MAEPFKLLINEALVRRAGTRLAAAWPGFDAARFERQALDGLDGLELKARALQVCAALEATLPERFEDAAPLVEACLQGDDALDGWVLWPFGEFVARRGLDEPGRALAVLHALTQRFTAEFAIRPFIVRHPALVFDTLARWVHDDSEHVRRLVSEGSRPRLPWGLRLAALVQDPSPTLPLLRALQDDPSAYVRRSVANHLNDIAKDHPARVVAWVQAHLPGAGAARRQLLRHASRTLIKAGDRDMLAAWGLGAPLRGSVALTLSPRRVTVGQSLQLALQVSSSARRAQRLEIDYVVHHVKADGRTTPKVFKGWRVELPAGGTLALARRHSMRPITTRRYHAGRHAVAVQVNGRTVAEAGFDLSLA